MRFVYSSIATAAFCAALTVPSAAQPEKPAAAAAPDEDDLEVPSSSSAAPPQTPVAPPQAPVNPSPAPSSPSTAAPSVPSPNAPSVSPPTPPDSDRVADLEQRLAAVEAALRARHANDTSNVPTEDQGVRIVNLERTAHSRPVPTGFVISGYLQADFDHSQLSEDQLLQGVPLNQNEFQLRRGRLRVDEGWTYAVATLELDANTVNGPAVGVRRAEASLFYRGNNAKDMPPLVMLTGGVTDLPFGYELLQSARMRVFMERSIASSAFYPTEADAGIKLSGAASFVRYGLAFSNGQPLTPGGFPRDPNGAKDLTGRLGVVVQATKALEIVGGTSFASGKGFSAGSSATKSTIVGSDTNGNGSVDPGETTFQAGQGARASANFNRWLFGLDLGFHVTTKLGETHVYGELYAGSNYDRGFLVADPTLTGNVRELGGYAAITQQVTRYGLVGFRYSVYDPNADFFESRRGNFVPATQAVRVFSPVFGFELQNRARLLFEYDFIRDYLARDTVGVPTDARNDTWTARLQVDL